MYTSSIIKTLIIVGAAVASARSIHPRQIQGSAECNAARARIVSALGDTKDSVGQIQDATVQDAASTGLNQAQAGILQIGKALIAGDAPPQDGRDQVDTGLAAAGDALAGGDTTDPAVADAQESLDEAVQAGQDVVANC
ncbi:hypothetical protein F4778DRAFT_753740 [Xylariomycetidae sp. FL2044]|nr:hypothetical protein F4778DRAFT_753740 [Xylariomycetidae sp. FL2044]